MVAYLDIQELYEQMLDDSARWFGDDVANNLTVMTLGLVGESGEVADIVKKISRGSLAIDSLEVLDHLHEELVDVFIYWVMLAGLLRLDLGKRYEQKREYNERRFG